MTQAHKTTQEQTGKIIKSAISQALTKSQATTVSPPTTLNTSNQNVNWASPPYNLHQTPTWHTTHPDIPHVPHVNIHPAYRHQELQTNTQSDNPGQQIYQAPTNLSQSVDDLLWHQTDLAHNM